MTIDRLVGGKINRTSFSTRPSYNHAHAINGGTAKRRHYRISALEELRHSIKLYFQRKEPLKKLKNAAYMLFL